MYFMSFWIYVNSFLRYYRQVLAGVLSRGGALLQDPTPENTCSDGSVIVHADGTRRSPWANGGVFC